MPSAMPSAPVATSASLPARFGCDLPPRPRSSAEWLAYFEANAGSLIEISWENGAELTDAERKAISSSVQGFQLGESSEGRHLADGARAYAEREDDADYFAAIRLFIKEEQRHARDLGRFMQANRIPLIKKTWPDTVFRRMRRIAGLELSISVLVTAEIIAKVYYPALRESTQSPILRTVCEQIVRDETPHVEFQTERLAMLRAARGPWSLSLRHALHRILMGGTIFVVWWKHGRVLRAGGLTLGRFQTEVWREFTDARRRMDPRSYAEI